MCSFPWLIAFPMACIGLYRTFQAQKATLTPTGQTVASVAMVANLVATIFGAMFVLLFLFYALYFCAILFFGFAGALGSSF